MPRENESGTKELVEKIRESLFTLFHTLSSANLDIALYHYHHKFEEIHRNHSDWNKLDEAYTLYEEQANNCRRLWMKLRAASEKAVSPGNASSDDSRPLTPALDASFLKPKPKKRDTPTSRSPTPRRLARIPKGAKPSVETTRDTRPWDLYTFSVPRKLTISESESRTKRNHPDSHSASEKAGTSTADKSVAVSPNRNHPSAREYWEPRRPLRQNDFQLDEGHLYSSLDCLGPPFHVNTGRISHNVLPATQGDLRTIYGGGPGITPRIAPERLVNHGFDGWMTPNMEYNPFLPARPGWPGLLLRLDDELEEWKPTDGTSFRLVIRKEPQFVEYLGQYEVVRLGDITGVEWNRQPVKIKKRWTQIFGSVQAWNDAIARIALRKNLGKEPMIEEFAKYTNRLTLKTYMRLAKDLMADVDRAFCRGDEVIAVWGMKCVAYDYKFEKHLAHSIKGIKPSPSPSPLGPSKNLKRRIFTRDEAVSSEGEDEGKGESSRQYSTPPKRQRVAKGKGKLFRYDWTGAMSRNSEDKDYEPTSS